MRESETLEILEGFRRVYPKFLPNVSELPEAVELWHSYLAPYPVTVCRYSASKIIATHKFAPAISELLDVVRETMNPEPETAIDVWNVFLKAARRASITTQEEFEALPYEVKRFCGNLNGLRDLSRVDLDTLNTVTRGQFMRTFESMNNSKKALASMPDDIKALVSGISENMRMIES
jgi:hypothetical protein